MGLICWRLGCKPTEGFNEHRLHRTTQRGMAPSIAEIMQRHAPGVFSHPAPAFETGREFFEAAVAALKVLRAAPAPALAANIQRASGVCSVFHALAHHAAALNSITAARSRRLFIDAAQGSLAPVQVASSLRRPRRLPPVFEKIATAAPMHQSLADGQPKSQRFGAARPDPAWSAGWW